MPAKRVVDVLLVDEEPHFLETIAEEFRDRRKFNIVVANSAKKALALLRTIMVDVVVADLNMAGTDGFRLLWNFEQLQHFHPGMKVIVTSAVDRNRAEQQLKGLHFARYFEKPVEQRTLAEAILDVVHGTLRTGKQHS